MVKFMFKTLMQESTFFKGPSGTQYFIHRGYSFDVSNKQDIEFFNNNKRFEKVFFGRSPEPEELVDNSNDGPSIEEYLKELEDIYGISKKLAAHIVSLYPDRAVLVKSLEEGYDLDKSIPDRRQEILKLYFLGDEEGDE